MSLILRSAKAFPLTNTELDGNFTYLSSQINTKLNITDFTSTSVLLKITTGPQGESSGIDASKIRGLIPTDQSTANTIVKRDANGDFQARVIFANIFRGKADDAITADSADTALTLSNTLPINKGGTSATTAATARVALGAVNIAGDILTGKLKFCATTTAISSLNIPKTLFIPTSPVEGDMWHSASGLNISTGGVKKTFAFLDSDITGTSENVTGIISITNGGTGSNTKDTARVALGAAKSGANTDITSLSSPSLGSATAVTQIATDSSNKVATTAFVTSKWSTLNANGNYVVNSLTAKSLGMNDLTFIKLIQEGAGDGAYPEIMMGRFGKPCNAPLEFWTSGHTPSNGSWDSLISASGGNGTNGSGNISIVGNLNVSGNVNGVNLSNIALPTPTAAVMAFYRSTAPSGWLECNGAAVSRTTYVNLWNAMGNPNTGNGSTTFNLPDLRGEFIRGWDHGKGTDPNRILGSWQKGTIVSGYDDNNLDKDIGFLPNHVMNDYGSDPVNSTTMGIYGITKVLWGSLLQRTEYAINSAYAWLSITRPRNIALMYCIKI